MTVLKAEKRNPDILDKPREYRVKDLTIHFDTEKLPTGQLVAGRYEKIERLGIGSFDEVWKVRDVEQQVGRPPNYVVKIAHSRKYNAHLRREAEICRCLEDHPNAVKPINVLKDRGQVVFVQEFVSGLSLKKIMARPVGTAEKESIVLQLVDIVAHAHQHGIMHRDIKPEHVIVQPDGTVKLLDYGVAKELKKKDFSSTVVGSRPYMAPEQIMGKSQIASDVWALGVIMYGIYTEYLPFFHETEKILMDQILKNEPNPPRKIRPSIPVELEEIILKCLKKDPSERYADAGVLKEALFEKMPHFGN
jgi:serine/threonine protein kinase